MLVYYSPPKTMQWKQKYHFPYRVSYIQSCNQVKHSGRCECQRKLLCITETHKIVTIATHAMNLESQNTRINTEQTE